MLPLEKTKSRKSRRDSRDANCRVVRRARRAGRAGVERHASAVTSARADETMMPTVPPGAVFVGPDGVPVMAVASQMPPALAHPPPLAPPPAPPVPKDELARACAAEAAALAREGNFASYQAVAARVCASRGVSHLGQLGASDPLRDVPLLDKIWRAQQLVEAHVAAFVGTRTVACLRDLDVELAALLRAFGFKPIARPEPARDPHEIPIPNDDEDDADDEGREAAASPPSGFHHFGLGPLLAIPAVATHFPEVCPARNPASLALDGALVMDALSTHLSSSPRRDPDAADAGRRFDEYLRGRYPSARAEGVLVRPGPIGHEATVARHVASVKMRHVAAAASDARAAAAAAAAAEARASRAERNLPPPRLREPAAAGARTFLETCVRELDSAWRPTRGKLHAAVRRAFPEASEPIAAAATEYGMLHLGGGKFRAKALETDEERDARVAAGANEETPDAAHEDEEEHEPAHGRPTVAVEDESSPSTSASSSDDDAIRVEKRRRTAAADPALPVSRHVPRADSSGEDPWEGRVGREKPRDASETVSTCALAPCAPWWEDVDRDDPRAVGRWGEALVYHHLVRTRPGWTITWLNEIEESAGFYDIRMDSPPDGPGPRRAVFVEVKTTRFADKNAFEVSPWEWDFACRPGVDFRIYRVYAAGDHARVRVTVVKNPAKRVREHAVSLCLAI